MTTRFLVVALALTALTACHPSTNTLRCDQLLSLQAESIAAQDGWLRCDPSYDSDEPSQATHVMQWNRYFPDGTRNPQFWLWDQRVPDDRALQILAWMGVYELSAYHRGLIPSFYLDTQHWGVPPLIEQEAYEWAVTLV